jgi:hypothetical protein
MTAARAMRFAAGRVIVVFAIAMLAAADDRIIAAEPIEIFDAHLHYNWEPQPYYRLDEVLALLRKHRVTGILATSRPNTGTHALVDAKAFASGSVYPAVPRPCGHRQLVQRSHHL